MKYFKTTFFLSFLFFAYCVRADENFIDFLKNKSVALAFNDGDIHRIEFVTNELGITTANYTDHSGSLVYTKLVITKYVDVDGSKYLNLYKDRTSSAGVYRFPVNIFIPYWPKSSYDYALVDLRWNYFERPIILLQDKKN